MAEHNVGNDTKKTDVHIGFPSFNKIFVAYDGMEMSKKALNYAAYFSKISDSEIVLIHVIKHNRDLNKVLPLTINVNLEGNEQQLHIPGSQQGILLDEPLRKVVEEMIIACKAAGLTKKIVYELRMGKPADEIINICSVIRFDLIIMGSRRIASRIEAVGSTTRKVLTKVKTPTLIVQKHLTYKDEY
ncbi:MAG: universal stress protein [Nitrososphaeraceae archaeon]|nr:universal stress protein [Nitrososphaeraceae archaeon]